MDARDEPGPPAWVTVIGECCVRDKCYTLFARQCCSSAAAAVRQSITAC
uniref:Metallothionein n=1 Tax=Mucor racemosus TaxID=4841 RepID=Q9Y762_RHIRA|nr:metallothionein [Mucor racemosus]